MNAELHQPILNIHGAFRTIKAQSEPELRTDLTFRSRVISSFLSFLAITARSYQFPWDRFQVPRDTKIQMRFCDEERGIPLIKAILYFAIDHLHERYDLSILVRDERSPICTRTAPETNQAFKVFQNVGGACLELRTEWLSDFYALLVLNRAVDQGEYTWEGLPDARLRITREDWQTFLAKDFTSGLLVAMAKIISRCLASAPKELALGPDRDQSDRRVESRTEFVN